MATQHSSVKFGLMRTNPRRDFIICIVIVLGSLASCIRIAITIRAGNEYSLLQAWLSPIAECSTIALTVQVGLLINANYGKGIGTTGS
jgi:hypothetical protein